MKLLSISAAIGAVVLSVLTVAKADLSRIVRVNQDTQFMIDAQGRTRHFHGTNMVRKSFPYHLNLVDFVPGYSLVDKDIEVLKSLNINSVRLGVHWAGAEPVRGVYNETYFDVTMQAIKKLQDNGIYTLVDQHQDVWSPQTCGHGAPIWFVKSDWVTPDHRMPSPQKAPFPVDANGVPSDDDCNSIDWAVSYLDYAVGNAFGRLYNNYDGLGDAWAAYWKKVAQTYKGMPGVMGYDLMNEPWVGDHMADPTLLVPGVADGRNMEPLWNKGNAAIRTVDPDTLVWFEGSTYDILNGFNNVPGGDGSKTVHSWHYYKPPQLGSIETTIKNRKKDNDRLRTMGVMTEFHFWNAGEQALKDIKESVYQADRYMLSWHGWAYEEMMGRNGPDPALARLYARSYAEATAGTTQTMYFQDTTAKYWVSWKADTSITAPGLIRIAPQYYYPDGIRVFFVPAGTGTYTMEGTNTVQLHYTAQAQNGQTIQASVQPFFPTDIVKNPASGKCMDNGNAYVTANNPIMLWDCSSSANQVWKFKEGRVELAFDPSNKPGAFCLDTLGAPTQTVQRVVLNACTAGKASQQWSVVAGGAIKNTASGLCVDIEASNYNSGRELITYRCTGNPNQAWILPRGANGTW